ncbi:MAG: hypothetical protein WEB93_02420 [Sphingomonadales bacterium]
MTMDHEMDGRNDQAVSDALLVRRAFEALPDPVVRADLRSRVLMREPVGNPGFGPVPIPDTTLPGAGWFGSGVDLGSFLRGFWPQMTGLAAASFLGFAVSVSGSGLPGVDDTDLTPFALAFDMTALEMTELAVDGEEVF